MNQLFSRPSNPLGLREGCFLFQPTACVLIKTKIYKVIKIFEHTSGKDFQMMSYRSIPLENQLHNKLYKWCAEKDLSKSPMFIDCASTVYITSREKST